MKKSEIVELILGERIYQSPKNNAAVAYAPTNIALVKYWGKRDQEINLPVTSSLSVSLAEKGAETTLVVSDKKVDTITLNNQLVDSSSAFAKRLSHYLDLFRIQHKDYFDIQIRANIPVAAGLASSACGFAALIMVLNKLYGWELSQKELSILARLGSGSACRSIWNGFVEWQKGESIDGMDSHGELIDKKWPELCVGLHIMTTKEKIISSREAMQRTIETSALYSAWPEKVRHDMQAVKRAIQEQDFDLLGKSAESNALNMHATMLSAWPPVCYALPETISAMQKIWELRKNGLALYFTQDAGPNLKLLFLKKDQTEVQKHFSSLEIVYPFKSF